MSQDSTHSLLRAAKHFFSGTMLSRITGLLRDMAMAFAFGTQGTVAAFLMAFRFAHLLRRLFGEGALQSAFIPLFERLRRDSPERAASFFADLAAALTLLLVLLIIAGMGICGLCLTLDLVDEGNKEILTYTLIMLPSLLFICLFGLNASLLQCAHRYFLPSAAPILFNLIWTAGALLLTNTAPSRAMLWLSATITLACAAQWALTLPQTADILRRYHPKILWRNIRLTTPDLKLLAAPLLLAIVGVSASQINNALDVIFARYASAEGPAYLWYAIRLQQLPLALFGIALAGALLPPLTRAAKENNLPRFHHYLSFALRRSTALMLPITAGTLLLGATSIELLYGHGDFHADSIAGTNDCLWGYAAGLTPMTLVLILAPAFYAQDNYRSPTIASLLSMSINITLNTFFIIGLNLGPSSVAWATSLSALANTLFLAYALKSHLPHILTSQFFSSIAKITASTALATLTLLIPLLPPLSPLPYIAIQTILFSFVFFTTSYLLNSHDAFLWKTEPESVTPVVERTLPLCNSRKRDSAPFESH